MQSNKSYRRNLHFVLENHIPQDVIDKGNQSKSWKYGYNKEYDTVIISKDGTIGDILEINTLRIALPKTPDRIRNEDLKQRFQKWRRYDVPQDLQHFDKIYKDEKNTESILNSVFLKHKGFIDADIKRIKNGDFFYNDGEIVYITGFHYFFLQHYLLTGLDRFGDFRMPQRDYFIFLEACFADDRCYGSLLLKARRSYFSSSSGSIILCKAIFTKKGVFPVVSKKDDDAVALFGEHIVTPLNELPKHLQPQREGEVAPKKELFFIAPKKKITTNQKATSSGSSGLNTRIKQYASTVDAYDGQKVTLSLNDEIGKFKGNLDINEYWGQSHKMCHKLGSQIVGKAICGSTANPPNLGGLNYQKFYMRSKISTRNSNGFTQTGLYSIFIPADYSLYGYCDEYGYAVIDDPEEPIKNEIGEIITKGAKRFLDEEENALVGDIKEYNFQRRNNPRIEDHAFLDENATSMYATEGVVNHTNFLREYEKTPKYQTEVFRYDLTWIDGIQDNPKGVYITRTKKGRFMGNWLPPVEFRNKIIIKDDKKYPGNPEMGCLGADPYQSDRAKYGGGSKQGFVGVTSNEDLYLIPRDQNKVFLYYKYRPDTVEEAIDDIIKAIIFFGMKVNPETNKKALVVALYKRGYRQYVIENPFVEKAKLSTEEKKYGGTISSGTTVPLQETALESWIHENVSEDVDEDDIKIPYLEMNEELQIYNGENRKRCDTTVALQMAVAGLSVKKRRRKVVEVEELKEYDIVSLFERD